MENYQEVMVAISESDMEKCMQRQLEVWFDLFYGLVSTMTAIDSRS